MSICPLLQQGLWFVVRGPTQMYEDSIVIISSFLACLWYEKLASSFLIEAVAHHGGLWQSIALEV